MPFSVAFVFEIWVADPVNTAGVAAEAAEAAPSRQPKTMGTAIQRRIANLPM
jgi:hypothetical protein